MENLIQFHQDHVVLDSLSDFLAPGELYLIGSTRRTVVQGLIKFYPYHEERDLPGTELIHRVHIMTTQSHPEFTEEIVSEILRSRHGKGEISDAGHEEYFGSKGHLSDTPPVIKTDTGKRWLKHYDGIRVVGRAFWRMLGVEYGNEHPARIPAWESHRWCRYCSKSPCGFANYLMTAAIQCQHGNLFFMTQKIFDRHFSFFIFHFSF